VAGPVPTDSPGGGLRDGRQEQSNLRERLWRAIPESYKKEASCYSDFWEAYRQVIPEERHEATGKEQGEASHVERWINTLRQRLSRFVRKTLSFSKSAWMHHCCLKCFICRYNLERRNIILERNTTVPCTVSDALRL
jgi:insertion element IS1 protein InsB